MRARDGATLLAVAFSVVALAALGAAALMLAESQREQRRDLRESYGQRADIASGLIDSILRVAYTSQGADAAERYTDVRPSTEQLTAAAQRGNVRYIAVLDPSGEVLGTSRGAPRDIARRMGRIPAFVRRALESGYGLGNAQDSPGRDIVEAAVAFESVHGLRVLVNGTPVRAFTDFLGGTLARLPSVRGGAAWVLDADGLVLGAAGDVGPRRRPDPPLLRASGVGSYDGRNGPTFYEADPIPASDWRIAITAPEDELYRTVSGLSRWLPWTLLLLGGLSLLAIGWLLRRVIGATGALRRSNADLARSNADLEQFAYVASHDLSEPLRTVAGFSQLLGKRYAGRLDAEADLYIDHMVKGVDRMQQLIDDLLVYSRVGRSPIGRDRVDLDALLDEVLAAIDPTVRERDAQITSDTLPVVLGERSQLGQVLQNLVVNAVKFTAPEVRPVVHIGARRRDGAWHISVRDNGIGVDQAQDQAIFKMFGRLHSREAYPGTGIGLALVKRIIERHGGQIWVEPAPGGGSIFTFTLPDRAPVPAPEPVEALA